MWNFYSASRSTSCILLCVSDAALMTEMRLEDLMEMKSYTKLIAKQSKQLESLRRKHEKVCYFSCCTYFVVCRVYVFVDRVCLCLWELCFEFWQFSVDQQLLMDLLMWLLGHHDAVSTIYDATFAKCAFRCLAPAVWNSLLKTFINSDSVTVVRSRLETFLFSQAFSLCSAY